MTTGGIFSETLRHAITRARACGMTDEAISRVLFDAAREQTARAISAGTDWPNSLFPPSRPRNRER